MNKQTLLAGMTASLKTRFRYTKKVFLSLFVLFVTIKTIAQPVADFSSTITSGCAPILVNFTDKSSGNPTEWKWDLGNGTFSNLQNPSNTYFNPGRYTVKLIVKATNQQDSIVKTNFITVYESPIANFAANATLGCTPFLVNFLDTSKTSNGNINSWQWDFGDGDLSTQKNPSHIYTLAGSHNVTLKVSNTNGCIATLTKSSYIKNNTVTAGFSSKVNSNCSPNVVAFQNESSSNENISYKWEFGDSTTSTDKNPIHTFRAKGNYSVKLTVYAQSGCIDTIVKKSQIQMPTTAAFTRNNFDNCKSSASIQFTNTDQLSTNYFWDFGDSTTSSLANPLHTYSTPGNYTVKLIAKNSTGCIDSVKKANYIIINPAIFTLKNIIDSGCMPFTKKLSIKPDSANTITSYLWNFGDGSISSDSTPTHTFSKLGYSTVSITATAANGCRDTAIIPNAIKVSTRPTANFSANPHIACAKTGINFTNLSSGSATDLEWGFGDLTTSNEKDPKHVYKDTGWKTVQLVVINGGCTDTLVDKNLIYIKPSVAKFVASMSCAQPFVRSFINISRGATSYLWDFGDGTTNSTDLSPVHTYRGNGNYTVTLTTWNDSTGCDNSTTKLAKIIKPIVSFFASDTVICKSAIVNFTSIYDTSEISRFYWNFGDGTKIISTDIGKISHQYNKSGVYSVTLITSSILNCTDTIVKSMYITVNSPKARFGASTFSTAPNLPIIFSDSSSSIGTNTLQKWIWRYGDGVIDTLSKQPVQHSFSQVGVYPVTLKLIDSQGCTDSFSISPSIRVAKVITNFSIDKPLACKNSPVKFSCPFAVAGCYYLWEFGDGTTSTLQNPTHNYINEGDFTIKLYIKTTTSLDSNIKVNAVSIQQPVANFEMSDSFSVCPPLLIQFTSKSINASSEYWDFGDSTYTDTHNPSHFYTYPGIYTITLTVKGLGGCVETMQRKIVVKGPRGYITSNQLKFCKPYNVSLQIHAIDAVSYIWDFNDGNTLPTMDSIVNHTYKDSGNFIPKIMLIDTAGCRVPFTSKDTILNLFANASFSFSDSLVCSQSDVSFTNTSISNDPLATYHWDFGDNTSSNEKNPVHQYNTPGKYYPTLTVTTSIGCFGQYQSSIPLKVIASPGMTLLSTDNGCAPLTATLSASQSETESSFTLWSWDFGNGNVSDQQYPPDQQYNTPGKYTVSLTAVNASTGCSKKIQHIIEAYSSPLVSASNDTLICKGQQITLRANGAANYKWTPVAGLLSDTGAIIKATPAVTTKYIVTGTTLGCSNSKTVTVSVKQPLHMSYAKSVSTCVGQGKHLDVSGASSYEWSPEIGLSNTNSSSPIAQPDSTTTYRVIGADDMGCSKDTGYIKLSVYGLPVVHAGEDKTTNVGQTVTIKPTISSDVTEVIWTPKTDIISGPNSLPDITVKPTKTTHYNIEVKNRGGCSASDNVTVFVICNGTNVFMPNLFSPNNDGTNDIFYPRGTGLYKIKTLRIFDRWGEAVFEKNNFNSNDPSSGWNGTYKGSKLNSEVFVYTMQVVCDNNEILDIKGTVMLKY